MLYKDFKGLSLSKLGLGMMRLPKLEGQGESIDEKKAEAMVERAINAGINYFDTAFRYHGGESEAFCGKVLSRYPRDQYFIASKMPGHMMDYKDGKFSFTGMLKDRTAMTPEQVFESQLERCKVDYFDFYLLHNLCETAYPFYSNPEIGIVDLLLKQKQAGRIKHLGFSAHGRAETIDKYLTEHPGCFEFGQIQLNYLDWTLQDAKRKYEVLEKHGLPVVVMEPVRGGKLADLGADMNAKLKAARPDESVAAWAFRYLQGLPNVAVVLSGMSTMAQLNENIDTFSSERPLNKSELALLDEAIKRLIDAVPCTGCRYCVEDCPMKLDIPTLIGMYNEMRFAPISYTISVTLGAMQQQEMPAACIGCKACERACPQHIDVADVMTKFAGLLEKR